MRKRILLVALIALTSISAFAQADYNKWAIEAGAGFNHPWRNMTPGYSTNDINFITGDIGVRFMMNEYLGLKADFGYNSFSDGDNSLRFESDYMRTDLQLVVNLGRVLHFEDWTRTVGLLIHGGGGMGWLSSDSDFDTDASANYMAGATLRFRVGNRFAINLDGTAIVPFAQRDLTYDGWSPAGEQAGAIFNGTLGLSVYLGKHKQHADWYVEEDAAMDEMMAKYSNLEQLVNDIKNGSVSQEEMDRVKSNVNNIADEVEELKSRPVGTGSIDYNDFLAELTKDGFTSIFFSFNSASVEGYNLSNVNFVNTYLQNNPNATVEVCGYADETGSEEYNQKLSQKRADAAAKILVDAGIDASRINAVGMGEDTTIHQEADTSRKMARRASFVIK